MQHKISNNKLNTLKDELSPLSNATAIKGGTADADCGTKPKDEGRGGTPPKSPAGEIVALR